MTSEATGGREPATSASTPASPGSAADPASPAFGLGLFGGPDPDVSTFVEALAPSDPRNRSLRKLYTLLVKIDPRKDALDREYALGDLVAWLRRGKDLTFVQTTGRTHLPIERRLRILIQGLGLFGPLRARLALAIHTLLVERNALKLLARVGIPGDRGLFSETIDRLSHRLMPQPDDELDITEFVARLFDRPGDLEWLSAMPVEVIGSFVTEIRTPHGGPSRTSNPSVASFSEPPPSMLGHTPRVQRADMDAPPQVNRVHVWAPLRIALLEGILLLASRVSAAGLSDAIRERSPETLLPESPFFKLPRAIDALLSTAKSDIDQAEDMVAQCFALTTDCREAARAVLTQLESQGVSVDVVYRLELIERSLIRIDRLVGLLTPQPNLELFERARNLFVHLLEERKRELSLSDIVRTNMRLLARKIIERTGLTGEHYITVTPGEYFKMLLSAGLGGVMTAGTAALKFITGAWQRAPLQEGLINAANYSGSFILMQFVGATLATKQPSMTASALAGALKKGDSHDGIVNTVSRITRSQLAAAIGNVSFVIPACIGLDYAWRSLTGDPHFLSPEKAEYVIHSLHATESGTIPYAALTGVILWLSSLAAGWLENWAVYRRLPEAIAEHRIRRYVGSRVTRWASRVFARNIAGIGGSSTLGFLLAMTPIFGKFVGIPLDVRHVTLSSGSLTLAVCTQGTQVLRETNVVYAIIGIAIIGTLNFGVSFVFALAVALRAREVTFRMVFGLTTSLIKGFFTSPFRFFLPVEKGATSSHHHH